MGENPQKLNCSCNCSDFVALQQCKLQGVVAIAIAAGGIAIPPAIATTLQAPTFFEKRIGEVIFEWRISQH